MQKFTMGGHEITLESPSEDVFDFYVESARRPGDPRDILLQESVVSPDPVTLAAILLAKPGYKRLLSKKILAMAGDGAESVVEDGPNSCKVLVHSEHRLTFRPANPTQFGEWEASVSRGELTLAAGRINKACLVEPTGEAFDAIVAEQPAIKYALQRAIVEEAGAMEELIEKK